MSLRIGSLFSGIGGLELGLEAAGLGPVIWQAESDDYCRRVLAKHWPGVRCYDDVKAIDERAERPDLICGGFPCQDISVAGKRAGIEGARSGLWSEFARIVGDLRPRFVVVENVPALLGRGMGRVLGDLSALGFDAVWDCVPAAAVGAPHGRDRIFIIAHSNADGGGRQVVRVAKPGGFQGARRDEPYGLREDGELDDATARELPDTHGERGRQESQRERSDTAELGNDGQQEHVADATGECQREQADKADAVSGGGHSWPEFGGGGWWEVESTVGRVVDELPRRVDRLRGLGNAVVPQVAEVIGRAILGGLS